jgi:hypothetical protein
MDPSLVLRAAKKTDPRKGLFWNTIIKLYVR